MKPELDFLLSEAGEEAVTDLLQSATRVTDAEPLIKQLYPRFHDPRKDQFRKAFGAILKARRGEAFASLTPVQTRVVAYLCDGLSQKEAASRMGISHFTVSKHCSNVCRKIGARSMVHAIAKMAHFQPGAKP